jgi:hypothetical protein
MDYDVILHNRIALVSPDGCRLLLEKYMSKLVTVAMLRVARLGAPKSMQSLQPERFDKDYLHLSTAASVRTAHPF